MKNLILLILIFSSFHSQAKTIFKIYNKSTGKIIKVKRGQSIKIHTTHDNQEKFYTIVEYRNDTLFTKYSYILVKNIHTLTFHNGKQPSIIIFAGPILTIFSPLTAFNNGKFYPKIFLGSLGGGLALTGLTYLYYKDAGVQRINLKLGDKIIEN